MPLLVIILSIEVLGDLRLHKLSYWSTFEGLQRPESSWWGWKLPPRSTPHKINHITMISTFYRIVSFHMKSKNAMVSKSIVIFEHSGLNTPVFIRPPFADQWKMIWRLKSWLQRWKPEFLWLQHLLFDRITSTLVPRKVLWWEREICAFHDALELAARERNRYDTCQRLTYARPCFRPIDQIVSCASAEAGSTQPSLMYIVCGKYWSIRGIKLYKWSNKGLENRCFLMQNQRVVTAPRLLQWRLFLRLCHSDLSSKVY